MRSKTASCDEQSSLVLNKFPEIILLFLVLAENCPKTDCAITMQKKKKELKAPVGAIPVSYEM